MFGHIEMLENQKHKAMAHMIVPLKRAEAAATGPTELFSPSQAAVS